MPMRRCNYPGCKLLVAVGISRCDNHKREAWGGYRTEGRVIKGDNLQRVRRALFENEPLCRRCGKALACIRDHIVPLAAGGADVAANTQGLCKACDKEKTDEDRKTYGF